MEEEEEETLGVTEYKIKILVISHQWFCCANVVLLMGLMSTQYSVSSFCVSCQTSHVIE